MYRFLSNILFIICYLIVPEVTKAGPVVIWNGVDAKFLNSGTIQVPGLAPGGVCKVDGTGLFSAGTISPSSVSGGVADSFAGYDGTGLLTSIPTWIHNSSGGAEETLSVTPTDVGSTLSIPYNASALNISPTNNLANTYLWQNLDQINLNGTNDYLGITGRELFVTQAGNNNLNGDLITFYPRIQLGVGGSGASSTTRDVFATVRESGTHTANTVNVIDAQFNQDGGATVNQAVSYNGSTYIGGTANFAYGINQAVQVDGTLNDNLYGANIQTNTNSAVSVADANILSLQHFGPINGSISGININEQGNIGGNANDLSSYRQGTVTGGYNSLSMARDGLNLNGANGLNINFNSNSATTGDYRAIIAGNDGTISQNGAGSLIFQNGNVSKSWTGYGMYLNADAGDGTSNIIGTDISIQNHTIAGQIFGFNLNNNSNVTGNNNITGLNVNNQGTGYRFNGVQVYNNKNMTEEIRGFQFNNDNANARTGTGLDINMSGAFIDDVQGLRVNMGTTTSSSTTNHVKSAEFSGGTFGVQSEYTPFNAANVEVGNNITMTASILNGSPLTGTDQIIQLIQSNLLVHDDISTGPFGLDTNMVALPSQIAVDSGKTVPLVRSLLLGTTVPSGSGGFITDHVVLELLGLPSFGGSVTNTNRYGIRDSQLIGANFCDGATGICKFLDVRDPNAKVSIAGATDLGTLTLTQNVQPNLTTTIGTALSIQTQDQLVQGTDPVIVSSGGAGGGGSTFKTGDVTSFSGDNSGSGDTGDNAHFSGSSTGGTAGKVRLVGGDGGTYAGDIELSAGGGPAGGNIVLTTVSDIGEIDLQSGANINIATDGTHKLNMGGGDVEIDANDTLISSTVTRFDGDISLITVGKKLSIQSGVDAIIGRATLVAGTVTVSNTLITANSDIFVTSQADGGVPGSVRVTNIIVGTSFDIVSTSVADTSTVAYHIIEEIP